MSDAFINTVTLENVNQAMVEIARECKANNYSLDVCRAYAEEIHPEFEIPPCGSVFAVSFNAIYRSVIAMPNK
jgi:hypothetical protein